MTSLKLGSGEGYSGVTVDPMSGDLPDAAGDIPQTSGDRVTASVHRSGCGGCGVEGLDL